MHGKAVVLLLVTLAVGLLFKSGDTCKTHSFVRKVVTYGYSRPKDTINGKRQFAPIRLWEEGLCIL